MSIVEDLKKMDKRAADLQKNEVWVARWITEIAQDNSVYNIEELTRNF